MSVIGSNILAGASGQGGGYNLTKSLRFRSSASAYLSRTPASAGNRKTWTWSGWVKRGALGVYSPLFIAGTTNGQQVGSLAFSSAGGVYDKLELNFGVQGTSTEFWLQTTQIFRDPSAWYHIVCAVDTTQATSSNRVKFYVNGAQVTALSSYGGYNQYPSQNYDTSVNNTVQHLVSRDAVNTAGYFDGYLAEVNFIDGQALTPSSFGETSTTTGVWIPKKYTGTYGTNGFYLPFTDTTSTSTLGTDFSGNSNTWTVNNISLTSGSTYDSMTDVPTLTSATTANYCTLNPLDASTTAIASNGNLKVTNSSSANTGHSGIFCTQAFPTSGLFYYEIKIDSFATASAGGFVLNGASKDTDFSSSTNLYQYSTNSGVAYANGTTAYTGSTLTTGDILGVAVDMTNGALYFAKNNTWQNSGVPTSGASKTGAISFTVANNILPACYVWKSGGGDALSANFGQQPFAYTPPAGFVALNTFNLPAPPSGIGTTAAELANKYMNVVTWTGNGTNSGRSITGVGFQPDWVWGKARSVGYGHGLYDAVRGTGKLLVSNNTNLEDTNFLYGYLSSFDSDGFSTTAGSSSNENWNQTNDTYVAWNWKASGATTSITVGQYSTSPNVPSIASTVSANTTAGFSIVTYTGNGSSPVTIGHGLGVTPAMIILKDRDAISSWMVKHQNMSSNTNIFLEGTGGEVTPGNGYIQNLTSSTTFGVINGGGGVANVNTTSNKYVAYCFAPVAGYSAFGSYTGNNASDGTFVYLGFRPKFIMIKSTSAGTEWVMVDSTRSTYNLVDTSLYANRAYSESTIGTVDDIDFLSNGFKLRNNTGYVNASQTYIYMAFAESPFKYANAR